jgi:hypothetical protein
MSPTPLATNFLAGSILSWALPIALLLGIGGWHLWAIVRHPAGRNRVVAERAPAEGAPAEREHPGGGPA